jgi:hypothetical protein
LHRNPSDFGAIGKVDRLDGRYHERAEYRHAVTALRVAEQDARRAVARAREAREASGMLVACLVAAWACVAPIALGIVALAVAVACAACATLGSALMSGAMAIF